MFTHENLSVIPSFILDHATPSLHTVKILPNEVHKKLLHINPNKSPGLQGWPLLALKETAEQICTPLSIIFKNSLESGNSIQNLLKSHQSLRKEIDIHPIIIDQLV